MRINEVVSPLKKYLATVRVSGTMAKTLIDAESSSHAILLLGKIYGKSNVVSSRRDTDCTTIAKSNKTQRSHQQLD